MKILETLSVPLFGNFSALYMYYTYVQIGTPAVSFSVVVDTGSSDFFIPQAGCSGCMPPTKGSPLYNGSKSMSSTRVGCTDPGKLICSNAGSQCSASAPCETSVTYGGSLTEEADLFKDVVQLNTDFYPADPVVNHSIFGAIYNITQLGTPARRRLRRRRRAAAAAARRDDETYPEGMLGLALAPLVAAGYVPLMDALLPAAGLPDVFSMCLTPQHGGMMTLGGVDPNFPTPSFTPLAAPPKGGLRDFYRVETEAVLVGGEALPGIPKSVLNENSIVDSGTPLPTLPTSAYAAVKARMLSGCATTPLTGLCGQPSNATLFEQICFTMSDTEIDAFPSVSLALAANVTLDIPPRWLLQRGLYFCDDVTQVGLALDYDPHFTVVGAPLLQRYMTVYDRAQQRVGFASAEGAACATPPARR
jgi:hypothetical protein